MNALIFGCGSKFGKLLTQSFEQLGYTVYGVSGTVSDQPRVLTVDWQTCGIQDFEKFLRHLPSLDLVVFNQNSVSVNPESHKLNSDHIFEIWKQSKSWVQSHYVNCVLPFHTLHTLAQTDKINDSTCVAWMLSEAMFIPDQYNPPLDYIGQKYQNYATVKVLSKNNSSTYIGLSPGLLDEHNQQDKATKTAEFLDTATNSMTGRFYTFRNDGIVEYPT